MKSNRLSFNRAFKDQKPFLKWFTNELPKILEENQLLKIRGILAHNDSNNISEHDLLAVRALILGIGQAGLLPTAMRKFHPKINELFKIDGTYNKNSYDNNKKNKKGHLKLAA